jgi:hypothetical protein
MEVTRLRQNVATTAFTPATSAAARETPALDRQRDAERAQRVELEAQLADQKAM